MKKKPARKRVQRPKANSHVFTVVRERPGGQRGPRYDRSEVRAQEQRGVWE